MIQAVGRVQRSSLKISREEFSSQGILHISGIQRLKRLEKYIKPLSKSELLTRERQVLLGEIRKIRLSLPEINHTIYWLRKILEERRVLLELNLCQSILRRTYHTQLVSDCELDLEKKMRILTEEIEMLRSYRREAKRLLNKIRITTREELKVSVV